MNGAAVGPSRGKGDPLADARGSLKTSRWHVGVFVILVVLGIRCTGAPDLFPGWSGDPLVMESPITGITPAMSVGLDLITLLASAAVLMGCARRGWRPRAWELVLYIVGGWVVAWYSLRGNSTLMNMVQGCQWLAGFGAAVASVQACRDAAVRRLVLAVLLGVGVMVALKGAHQVYFEHAAVYQDFLRNKAQVLEAHGWSEGSPMALAYERRISQADPTGWFGLSNVYATVMAAGMTVCVGLGAIGLLGLRGRIGLMGRGVVAALLVGAVVFGGGVWLSHSKGGFAAALMGMGLLAVGWALSRVRWRPSARALGIAAAVLPLIALVAVAVRGVVGERWSELSIYFRWFYLEGAARVITESPLLGVGPDGFKDAYVRLKPALSPEEVSSPHSWYVDLIATLGVGGWAWVGWVVWQLNRGGKWQSGKVAEWQSGGTEERSVRDDVRVLLVVFGVVTAAGALIEQRIASVDGTVLRVVSLVGAMVVGGVVCAALKGAEEGRHSDEDVAMARGAARIPVIAAVIAAVTHCQIEMTGITPGAGMWVLLLIAVGAGWTLERERARLGSSGTLRGRMGTATMVMAAVVPAVALVPLVRWERHIRAATEVVLPVPGFSERLAALQQGSPARGDSVERLARDLSLALGQAVPGTPSGVVDGVQVVRWSALEGAVKSLVKAQEEGPRDFQTARALSRLLMIRALGGPTVDRTDARAAEAVFLSHMDATGYRANGWAWVGTMRRTVYEKSKDPADARAALDAFNAAAALSPGEPMYRVEAARLSRALGRDAEAAKWASEALRVNEYLRLDPVRQLGAEELEEMRGLAGRGP